MAAQVESLRRPRGAPTAAAPPARAAADAAAAPLPLPPPPPPRAGGGPRELFAEAVRELWRQLNPDVLSATQRRDRRAPAPHADALNEYGYDPWGLNIDVDAAGAGRSPPCSIATTSASRRTASRTCPTAACC